MTARDCGDDDGCVVTDRRVGGRRMVRTAMAYDETLADRVRETLGPRPDLTERKMFGGLCLMAGGHMFCGILGEELMLRLGPDSAETALTRPHVRAMDFTGRPLKGMVYVEPGGFRGEQSLRGWLDLALGFVATLPPK